MAYNYYQPMGYTPMYQPQYNAMQGNPQPQIQMPQMSAGILWVDGYNEAAMYPVAPNAAVVLWDKTTPAIYLKKADATGKPSMVIYDLVERKTEPRPAASAQDALYATKTDLKAVSNAVEVLRQGFDEMRLKIDSTRSGEGAAE